MLGTRFCALAVLALIVMFADTSWSQTPYSTTPVPQSPILTCKVYSLRDFGESPELCGWIAETIPQMIEPGTWGQKAGSLRFHEKTFILVVNQTADVHTKIGALLNNMRSALLEKEKTEPPVNSKQPQGVCDAVQDAYPIRRSGETPPRKDQTGIKPRFDPQWSDRCNAERRRSAERPANGSRPGNVMRADYVQPGLAAGNDPFAPSNASSYPVPPPLSQPKHLFHLVLRFEGNGMEAAVADVAKRLGAEVQGESKTAKSEANKAVPIGQLLHFIIRYEGEGIIDANVVEFMKAFQKTMDPDSPKTVDPLRGESLPVSPFAPPRVQSASPFPTAPSPSDQPPPSSSRPLPSLPPEE